MPEDQPFTNKIIMRLQYRFSNDELLEIAKALADSHQQAAQLEQQKKEVVADYKARIEAKRSIGGDLSEKINRRYEYRDIDCLVQFHTPVQGKKTTTRLDTNEEVDVRNMAPDELQEQLPFDIGREQSSPPPPSNPVAVEIPDKMGGLTPAFPDGNGDYDIAAATIAVELDVAKCKAKVLVLYVGLPSGDLTGYVKPGQTGIISSFEVRIPRQPPYLPILNVLKPLYPNLDAAVIGAAREIITYADMRIEEGRDTMSQSVRDEFVRLGEWARQLIPEAKAAGSE